MEEEPELSKDDKLKERIRLKIELLRLSILSVIATSGGIVNLVAVPPKRSSEYLFIAVGILWCCVAIGYARSSYNKIKKLTR